MNDKQLQPLTDAEFEERVTRSRKSVVVDFWAPWCDPCKLVHSILEKLAVKYGDQVEFLKMNVDEEESMPNKYSVRNLPTILFFKQGKLANQIIGIESENKIEEAVRNLL